MTLKNVGPVPAAPDRYEPSYNLDYDQEVCLSHVTGRALSSSIKCLYPWIDVDKSNEAHNRQFVSQIRTNSDRFLNTHAAVENKNPDKGRQLVGLVKYLRNNGKHVNYIFGESKTLIENVLRDREKI